MMEIRFDVPLTSYKLKINDTVIFLDVLACADSSLVDLQIENSTIIQMHPCEFLSLTKMLYGYGAAWSMMDQLTHHGALKVDEPLILLETIGLSSRQDILNALKLYKGTDIYSVDMIAYRYDAKNKRFWHGGIGKILNLHHHSLNEIPGEYILTKQEKKEFPQWYSDHKDLIQMKVSPRFREILQIYFESYRIGRINASFVMLFVVLEMLYSDKSSQISTSIGKGVSELLGKNTNAARRKAIRNAIITLYHKRSRYVHDGESVGVQDLFDLRDYAKKVIVQIFDRKLDDGVLNFAKKSQLNYNIRILEFCNELNMQVSDLSKRTQISKDLLDKIISGQSEISLEQALRISKSLGKKVEEIFELI